MCLLAVLFRMVEDAPLIVGANREEDYARGGTEPDLREGPLPFVAGLDPVAGGTWLGVNARGVLIAVTNRPKLPIPESPRSRGLLVRDLLAARTAREARDQAITALDSHPYMGCNLICADADDAFVIQGGDWLRVMPLPPGAHVITNADVNQMMDPRVAYSLGQLRPRDFDSSVDAMATLCRLCSQSGPPVPICLRGPRSGTVSSTVLTLPPALGQGALYHAQGPPDRVPYQDRSDLLQQLARAQGKA